MSNLFKCSLIWSSPVAGEFVLTFLLVAGKELLKAGLSSRHKSMVSHLYFVDDVLVESFFFVSFHMLCQIQLQVDLHYHNPVPVRLNSSLTFLLCHPFMLLPLVELLYV